jgi:hypothetical protein
VAHWGRARLRPGILSRAGRHPFLIVGIVVAVLVVWFLWALFQPFHGDGSGQVAVTVPKAPVSAKSATSSTKGSGRQLDPVPDPRHPRRQALRALSRHYTRPRA